MSNIDIQEIMIINLATYNIVMVLICKLVIVGITFVLPLILFIHFLQCYKQGNDICLVKNIPHKQS